MTKPLALLCYEKLIPGSQLRNRLSDLGYRVNHASTPQEFIAMAVAEPPLIVFVDMRHSEGGMARAVAALRAEESTAHLPVIAYAPGDEGGLQYSARKAGANLVVLESTLLAHLDQFMDQALQV